MEWWDDRPGFEAAVWRREKLVIIVPPDHPWARRRSVEEAMLLREPFSIFPAGPCTTSPAAQFHAFLHRART